MDFLMWLKRKISYFFILFTHVQRIADYYVQRIAIGDPTKAGLASAVFLALPRNRASVAPSDLSISLFTKLPLKPLHSQSIPSNVTISMTPGGSCYGKNAA